MKFYLVKNDRDSFVFLRDEPDSSRKFKGVVQTDITPVNQSIWQINKCTLLKNLLEKEISYVAGISHSKCRDDFWKLIVFFQVSNGNGTHRNGRLILPRDKDGDVLSKLVDLFPGITVQVDLSVLENKRDDASVLTTVSSKEMELVEKSEILFKEPVLFPAAHFHNRGASDPLDARVTITVTIPDDIFTACFGTVTLPQKMLEDAVLTDVTIVCGDGKKVQAHRNFLATRSSVFLAMFQTDMKESRESTVKIPDMDEKTVRAFLKYLYYDDTEDAEDDFEVAFELFKAGHKYDVQCLEGKMKELIGDKSNDEIDMEGALKLFLFARNLIPKNEEFMKKAANVLERYSKNLQKSPEMQELFRTDYQAALELLEYSYGRNF